MKDDIYVSTIETCISRKNIKNSAVISKACNFPEYKSKFGEISLHIY